MLHFSKYFVLKKCFVSKRLKYMKLCKISNSVSIPNDPLMEHDSVLCSGEHLLHARP